MVKPGGTGSPRLAISARLPPLPPSRSLRSLLPSAKSYTYLVIARSSSPCCVERRRGAAPHPRVIGPVPDGPSALPTAPGPPDGGAMRGAVTWWRRWTAITTAGELAGFAVPATVGALATAGGWPAPVAFPAVLAAGFVEGCALGYAQGHVWRSRLPA